MVINVKCLMPRYKILYFLVQFKQLIAYYIMLVKIVCKFYCNECLLYYFIISILGFLD
jgi:hypothetical protein